MQAAVSRTETISLQVIEGTTLYVVNAEAVATEKPVGKMKFRRAKKKKRADKETAPITLDAQQSAPPPPPSLSVSDETESSTSGGTTYERFCRSLRRLSPRTQERLRNVWNGEQACSLNSFD